MSDICLALCFAYLGGFVATFALAARYMFRQRALGRGGFDGVRTSAVWLGAAICALLWPLTVDAVVTGLVDAGGGAT